MAEKFGEQPKNEDIIDTTKGGEWVENKEGILEFTKKKYKSR